MAVLTQFVERVVTDAGLTGTLHTSVRKLDGNATFGEWWDSNLTSWVASDPGASDSITPTEDGDLPGHYTAVEAGGLDGFDGTVGVWFYTSSESTPFAFGLVDVQDGFSITGAQVNMAQDTPAASTTGAALDASGASTVSPVIVGDAHTWTLRKIDESYTARNVVQLSQGQQETLAMDFTERLNPGTSISSVSSVADDSSGITYTNTALSQDKTRVHTDATAPAAASTRYVTITVVTTDGRTIKGRGSLVVV